jgi:hypothetical protein
MNKTPTAKTITKITFKLSERIKNDAADAFNAPTQKRQRWKFIIS